MNHNNRPENAPSDTARQEQRLNAFWHKALAAAPEAPIDRARLAAARTAIFAAAQQHSRSAEHTPNSPWQALRAWCSAGAPAFAPPRWATGLASITLASLVLVLWYERMPEPTWDFDTASVMPATAPVAAPAPAPATESAAMHDAAPEAAAQERYSARQAPQAPLERAPSAAIAEVAPTRKIGPPAAATAEADAQPQTAPQARLAAPPPMPAPTPGWTPNLGTSPGPVIVYGQADTAIAPDKPSNQAVQAAIQQADGWAWRANAQSLFAPLDARQGLALTQLLQPLAQQAQATAPDTQQRQASQPQALLQRDSQQVLFKQAGQVHLIAHIMATPQRQIDWFSPGNAWIASTPISEAAYNRIIQTLTSAQ